LLRKFGPKREEVAGSWKRVNNEEFRNLYAPPNIIRVIMAEHVACMGEIRRGYKVLVGKRRRRSEGNITIDLSETGWKGVDWMRLDQDRDPYRPF
jgi:hypothetical protein